MRFSTKVLLIAWLVATCVLHGRIAVASTPKSDVESCDIYTIVGKVASSSLRLVSAESRKQLEGFYFPKFDPLYKINIRIDVLDAGVDSVRLWTAACVKESKLRVDSIYNAIFSDKEWGRRTLILAMAQESRHERLNMVDCYIGFLLDVLKEGVVPPPPPRTCKSPPGASAARFVPEGVDDWFRVRYLGWVECADGQILAYLPEIGWRSATKEQIDAIRSSSPSCCRKKQQ